MTEQKIRATVQADYNSSTSEVFTRAIIADIKASGSLRSLSLVTTVACLLLKTLRSFARSIFNVIITGYHSTYSGWEPYHVRYADEDVAGMDSPWTGMTRHAQSSEQSKLAEDTSSYLNDDLDQNCNATNPTSLMPITLEDVLKLAVYRTKGRTLILPSEKYLGLAPIAAEFGDQIFVLDDLNHPAILQPQEGGSYQFIGAAYVHGIMDGYWPELLQLGLFDPDQKKRLSIR